MSVAVSIVFTALGYLIGIALIPRILVQRRESGATLAWVLLILFVPYLGVILFWGIGTSRIRWRRRRRLRAEAAIANNLARSTEGVRRFERDEPGLEQPAVDLARLADRLARPCSVGNAIELLVDAEPTFSRIEAAIASAHAHVHVEFYIWRADEAGRRLRDVLVAVARRGIEVRVLVDDVGGREANRAFFRPLLEAGGRVARSMPVNILARRLSLNLRNHRKIVVVDGAVGFTGGLNVGDEYWGRVKRFGPWRDTHLRIEGPAVARLQEVFVEDWFHATREDLTLPRFFPDPVPSGQERIHILASGPDDGRFRAIHAIHFAAVTLARKRAWLTTPYFVPDQAFAQAVQTAALRGADVRLLLPAARWLDEPLVGVASRSFFPELLEAGVQIFEYQPGFLHAKTATVDGCWATVGSANLDRRSFRLNFEANAVAYGPHLAQQLERVFEKDLESSRRIDLAAFRARPYRQRALEGAARVLAPLL